MGSSKNLYVLARGVHVNVNASGLPPAGGHIDVQPNSEGTRVVLGPADKATSACPIPNGRGHVSVF